MRGVSVVSCYERGYDVRGVRSYIMRGVML